MGLTFIEYSSGVAISLSAKTILVTHISDFVQPSTKRIKLLKELLFGHRGAVYTPFPNRLVRS